MITKATSWMQDTCCRCKATDLLRLYLSIMNDPEPDRCAITMASRAGGALASHVGALAVTTWLHAIAARPQGAAESFFSRCACVSALYVRNSALRKGLPSVTGKVGTEVRTQAGRDGMRAGSQFHP